MESGKVLFFDARKGFGKLQTSDNKEVFIHFTQIIGDSKILIEDERVEFDLISSPKGLIANNLKRLDERYVGVITEFDKGFGFINANGTDDNYFVHHSEVIGKGFKRIEAGFEVEFTPAFSDKGPQAKQVILRDTRSSLEKFSSFKDWDNSMLDLANNHAQKEDGDWDYIVRKTGRLPVLESYITYTFARLHKEEKIKYATSIENGVEKKYACFNTGLATSKQEEIFAYFEHKDNFPATKSYDSYLKQPIWIFKTFDRESNRIMNQFVEKPELANYFQNAAELIYDTSKRLIPDYEHIIDDREDRFQSAFDGLSKSQQVERVRSAINSALSRVQRNYKTAIPQFYSDSIQLLLPLCIKSAEVTDVALVVAKEGEVYRANTVLPLDWAYNNARLLARPDREWLNP